MKLLAGERRNITVVGGEDRSIYGWRGANIRSILDFERDFPGRALFVWSGTIAPPATCSQPPVPSSPTIPGASVRHCGPILRMAKRFRSASPDAENEALVDRGHDQAAPGIDPRAHIAVLYRPNSQSRSIEEALRRYGRKYMCIGGLGFYQRAEVKDILAYLKLLVSQQDNLSLLRIINVPARGIGRTTVDQLELVNLRPTAWAFGRRWENRSKRTRSDHALSLRSRSSRTRSPR